MRRGTGDEMGEVIDFGRRAELASLRRVVPLLRRARDAAVAGDVAASLAASAEVVGVVTRSGALSDEGVTADVAEGLGRMRVVGAGLARVIARARLPGSGMTAAIAAEVAAAVAGYAESVASTRSAILALQAAPRSGAEGGRG